MQMQMQMQTFGLLCVHVHTYAHTPWLLRQTFLHHPVVALMCLATWCTERTHQTCSDHNSYLMFGIELKESN